MTGRGLKRFALMILMAPGAALLLAWGWSSCCGGKSFDAPGRPFTLATTRIGGVEYVRVPDLAHALGLGMNWEAEARRLELRSPSISILMMPGVRCIVFDRKTTGWMSVPLLCVKGVAFLPADFITVTLKPYHGRWPVWRKNEGTVIVLDPGHGGKDQGATGTDGVLEKNLTLDLAQRVRSMLVSNGYAVVLTRTMDTHVELDTRAQFANDRLAAAMVGIHANAVSSDARAISGIETFYAKKPRDVDTAVVRHVVRVQAMQGKQPWWARMPGFVQRSAAQKYIDSMRAKSRGLAQHVQARVCKTAVGENRGVKARNMVVLRNALCPACLVEVGFISNPVDARRLRDEAYKDSIARAIALGIIDSIGTQ